MKTRVYGKFTIILLIVGFMIAIQYNSVKKPDNRDTRDIWTIRQELSTERELHSQLLTRIRAQDQTLLSYQNAQDESPSVALNETIHSLKKRLGLTELTGPGIELTIEPSLEGEILGEEVTAISPDLLTQLLNEINRFSGNHVEIDGKRVIYSSAIRDINGKTTVNALPIQLPPFTIKVVTASFEEAERLHSHLESSLIADDFFVDNLTLTIGDPKQVLTIAPYTQRINTHYLKELTEED
ncbi:DUF881 domain-containing protein [Paenisporosarcina cavernae]|uniref:DUF881 domain-containing protein n=1 Tax=Paenisporosarcina cavernae TaxID=2320858 RepID=A0A385YRP3_9BACL|nr:DUF881 domain-containing protein [Paenisporosarcina cavernae]AYC29164.1 DUF881 domain-containing protein [Paenisporosarcina cavernae]